MDRHTCRIVVIRVLYQLDINKHFNVDDDVLDRAIAYAIDPLNEDELPLNLEVYNCNQEDYDYILAQQFEVAQRAKGIYTQNAQ